MKKTTQERFLTKAIEKHGSKYDYSPTVYTNAHTKITVICPIHGSFSQKASAHLLYGCRQCGTISSTQKRQCTLPEFVSRAHAIHQAKYDYQLVHFDHQHQKIAIICPHHGVFQQAVNDHLKGHGCRKCGEETTLSKRRANPRYTVVDFIQRAIDVHGIQYGYEKVVYRGSYEPVTITCKIHGDFTQSAIRHLQGGGCLKCASVSRQKLPRTPKAAMLFDEFEERARSVHGDKYEYRYYSKLTDKVGIECPRHGLFMQTGTDHIFAEAGCPFCAWASINDRPRYTQAEYETMLTEKWEDRITMVGDYHDLITPTTFSCLAHGSFTSDPWHILSHKYGCPQCRDAIRRIHVQYTQDEFEQRAMITHNRKYQYGRYCETDKVEIECPRHGLFRQNTGNHLSGMGCPSCGCHKIVMQNRWLDRMGVKEREVSLTLGENKIKADGYDPITNTIYQFWTDFWHGNPRVYAANHINTATGTSFAFLYQKTLNKRQLITSHGYQLVEIWEQDWKKIYGQTT